VLTAGDIVIDLFVDDCPRACENFLKLCKVKYYNFAPFYSVEKGYTCQTGDPNYPKGDGGTSVWGLMDPDKKRWFRPEMDLEKHTHRERGTVSMVSHATEGDQQVRIAGSQFIVTLGDNLESLDGKEAPFGQVVEGFETLKVINDALVDEKGRPLRDIRIRHTHILEDPFEDPEGLQVPDASPGPSAVQLSTVRIGDEETVGDVDPEAADRQRRDAEARSQALTLEMIGDLPFAEARPEENVLFVCKLNPVTQDEDLELIFSRFGKIVSCEIVRDKASGESLQYAFIEFDTREACERAYFKMEGVLIDDHRIHVDFSQSVAKVRSAMQRSREPGEHSGHRDRSDGARYRSRDQRDYDRRSERDRSDRYRRSDRDREKSGSNRDRHSDRDRSDRDRHSERYSERDRNDRYSDRYSTRDRNDQDRDRYSKREHSGQDRHSDRYSERNRGRDSDRDRHRERHHDSGRDRYREGDRDRYREGDHVRYRERRHSNGRNQSHQRERSP
jgi:peptidyl-prolyl cis-trans isomerase-like 4